METMTGTCKLPAQQRCAGSLHGSHQDTLDCSIVFMSHLASEALQNWALSSRPRLMHMSFQAWVLSGDSETLGALPTLGNQRGWDANR